MASDLLAALPGAPVSVREALPTLAHAWAAEGDEVVRASQLNLVLLLGPGTTPAAAAALIEQAQGFARNSSQNRSRNGRSNRALWAMIR